jgi:AraC-like DNA-binding protein
VDPLSDVLSVSGVRGTLGARVEAGGSWATAFDDLPDVAALHIVTAGTAWLTSPGRDPLELATGDVVLVGAGIPHTLGDAAGTWGARCDREATARATLAGEVIALGPGPVTTRIVSLAYVCDRTVLTQVLTGLPDVVHVAATVGACLDDTVRMLGDELATPRIAATAVLNSLVDIVLVQVFRAWTADRPAACAGTWLAMAGDPVVGAAVAALHSDPARGWTTSSLAAAIPVSRATLARRFPAVIGTTPAAYLTAWRMDLAAARLRRTLDPIEVIAPAVGYLSVPAFTRAFTRAHGRTPGRYRTEFRAGVQPQERAGA